MSIVNVFAACLLSKNNLVPWNIISVTEVEHSFRKFFYVCTQPLISIPPEAP